MTQVQDQDIFWPYRIDSIVNESGELFVYRVYGRDGQPLAVKLLPEDPASPPADSGERQTILRPIQALRHPAAVPVIHVGDTETGSFFVQPWMDGGSLADRRRPRQAMVDEVVPLLERIVSALEAAYNLGLVHKWLRPENILYDSTGQPFLSDAGFADLYYLTHNKAYPFAPPYSAPEMTWSHQIDPSADVYSLAVIAAEMLTGRQLQSSELFPQSLNLRGLSPDLYELVRPVLVRALAQESSERYPTPGEFFKEFGAAMQAWQSRREADASFLQQNFPRNPGATQQGVPLNATGTVTTSFHQDSAAADPRRALEARRDDLAGRVRSEPQAPDAFRNVVESSISIAGAALNSGDTGTADTFLTVAEQDWENWQANREGWERALQEAQAERERLAAVDVDDLARQPALQALDKFTQTAPNFNHPDNFLNGLVSIVQNLEQYFDVYRRLRRLEQESDDPDQSADLRRQFGQLDLSQPDGVKALEEVAGRISDQLKLAEQRKSPAQSKGVARSGKPSARSSKRAEPVRPFSPPVKGLTPEPPPDWAQEMEQRHAALDRRLKEIELPPELASEARRMLDTVILRIDDGDQQKAGNALAAAENLFELWVPRPDSWLAVRRQLVELRTTIEDFPDPVRRSLRSSLTGRYNQALASNPPDQMLDWLNKTANEVALYQTAVEELDSLDDLASSDQDRRSMDQIRKQLLSIRPKDQGKVYGVLDQLERMRAVLGQPGAAQPAGLPNSPVQAELEAGAASVPDAVVSEPGPAVAPAGEGTVESVGRPARPEPAPSGGDGSPGNGGRFAPPTVVTVSPTVVYTPPEPPKKEHRMRLTVRLEKVELDYDNRRFSSPNLLKEQALLYAEYEGPLAYGEALFHGLIHSGALPESPDPPVATGYALALEKSGGRLALELRVDNFPTTCRWELLKDPQQALPFSVREQAPFFRRYGTLLKDPVPADPLRVLFVVANPRDLGQTARPDQKPVLPVIQALPPVDTALEMNIIERGMARLKASGLAEYEFLPAPVTLDAIKEKLQEGGFHVLHILAHGVFIPTQQKYYLVLEDENGYAALTPAADFDATLWDGGVRLVVLASCQSGNLSAGASNLPALAPGLMQNQLSAVIAMQGDLPFPAAQLFHSRFYDDLARTGRIDMALSATRYDLYRMDRDGWSWGLPLLLMSSGDGLLFQVDEERASHISRPKLEELEVGPEEQPDRRAEVLPALANALSQQLSRLGVPQDPARIANQLAGLLPAGGRPPAPGAPLAQPQDRAALRGLAGRVALRARPLQQFVRENSGLELDARTFDQIASALNTGKHLILIGPPGTGKTSLAQDICRYAEGSGFTTGAVLATATADWTTFDTVGGYVPAPDGTLHFRPGIFLEAIREARWLVIDEINRAEIDKAFGELFTVLSGQQVDLPWTVGGEPVRVTPPLPPGARRAGDPDGWAARGGRYGYAIHPTWRIIGTMNVYDKSSLFQMSFAFMRRFAFVDVDLPVDETYFQLLDRWLKKQGLKPEAGTGPELPVEATLRSLLQRRGADNPLMQRRALGPAIVKDMIEYIGDRYGQAAEAGMPGSPLPLLMEAFLLYVVSQLDGLDYEGIRSVYRYLYTLFNPLDPAECEHILARIRLLYPHIPLNEWESGS